MSRKTFFSFFLLTLIFVCGSTAFAQNPAQIDVQTLTVTMKRAWTDALFNVTASNSAQTEVLYGGVGSFAIFQLQECMPCKLPNTFTSNGFQIHGFGFSFRWQSESYANFYVTSIESDPVVLRPTIRRKPNTFSVNGKTRIRGRLEFRNINNIVVITDNDIVLEGSYTAKFSNNLNLDGRKVEFSEITYTLNQVK